jgi:hypothetical protein
MATRTGSGFTDVISDVVDKSEVLESGAATLADRSFVGESIGQLAKLTGGATELGVDFFGNKIVEDLQQARNEAFKEYQDFTKRGKAAVAQGKTPKALYNAALVTKVQEIEARYPGFAEEVEDAKKALGLKPRQSVIEEEQRIRQLQDQALLNKAQTLGTLRYNPDRSIDFQTTFEDTQELQASISARSALETAARNRGVEDPSKHSSVYLQHSEKMYTDIHLKFSNESQGLVDAIDEITLQGGDPKELLTQGLVKLNRWEATQLNQLRAVWRGKDLEQLEKYTKDKVATVRQIITGSKEPQGIAKNLEMYNELTKNMDIASLRDANKAISKLINIGGDAFKEAIFREGTLRLLAEGKVNELGTTLGNWAIGVDANSLQNPPSYKGEPLATAQAGLSALHKILEAGEFTEENAQLVFGASSKIAAAHVRGELRPEDYDAVRKSFVHPAFKGFLDKQPQRKQRELGSFAFDVFNAASEKHLAQITQRGFFKGIEYNQNSGKLEIRVNEQGIVAAEQIGGPGIRTQIKQDEATLNKFFDDLNFYHQFKDIGNATTKMIRDMNGEAIGLRYAVREEDTPTPTSGPSYQDKAEEKRSIRIIGRSKEEK